jgi:hypothetical protein
LRVNPVKIVGLVLVVLGFAFRAVSLAYFNLKAKSLPDTPLARRRHESSKRNALFFDALFIVGGFYVIIRGV